MVPRPGLVVRAAIRCVSSAFSYIENVQNGLKKFIDEVEPQIEYYDKYGVVVEGMIPAHDFALKKISTELKELKKLLPEDILDDRR